MILNEDVLNKIIREELTKHEVNNMIDRRLDNYTKDRDLKKVIREISIEVLDDFFKELWQKRSFWKSPLKNK